MANLFQPSLERATKNSGAPASGAKLYFYLTGTLILAPIYTSSAGTTPMSNPVVADSTGIFPAVYLDVSTTYRVRWTDSLGSALRPDVDPVLGVDQGAVQTAATAAAASAVAANASAVGAAASATNAATSATGATASLAASTVLYGLMPKRSIKTNDQSVTSSTTLISDPELIVPLPANAIVAIKGTINFSASAAGDLKWRHTGPAAPTAVQINRSAVAAGDTAFSGVAVDTAYSAADITVLGAAGSGTINFTAVIKNGSTAGNFVFQWAQNTSDGTPTIIKAGSSIEYVLLPVSANFAFSNAAIAKLGAFDGPTLAGGHNVINAVGSGTIQNSYLDTVITGSAAYAQLFAGSYTITVDGVVSIVTAPAGWSFVNLFTGLPDAAHRVSISGNNYDNDIAIQVTGTVPSIARPSDVPLFYELTVAPYNGYIARDGVSSLFPYSGTINTSVRPAGSVSGNGERFAATTTSVKIWCYCNSSSTMVLLQDGVVIATVVPPSTGKYQIITLATGLSGLHEYEIKFISISLYAYSYAILVDSLATTAHTARACDIHYGDSIVQGASSGLTDARLLDMYLLAEPLGRTSIRVGVGGTGVSVDAAGSFATKYGRDHTADITGVTSTPSRVFVRYGVNDLYYGTPLATFQTDYTTMLANIRTGLPSAKIYAVDILPQYRNLNSDRLLYNAKISLAVAARVGAGDGNVVYVNTDGWISTTPGIDLNDSVHPNGSGYAKIATQMALIL